jgi:hypothetical protein
VGRDDLGRDLGYRGRVTLVDQSWADRHPTIVAVGTESGRGTDVTGTEAGHPWGTMAPCRIGGVVHPARQLCVLWRTPVERHA